MASAHVPALATPTFAPISAPAAAVEVEAAAALVTRSGARTSAMEAEQRAIRKQS